MNPIDGPLETVSVAPACRATATDTMVVATWRDHHEELFAFLVRTTRNADAAEDLLQEAFFRLTRELRAGRKPDTLRAWLYRVSANLAVSRGRRISAALRGIARLGAPSTPSRTENLPEAGYLRREARAELIGMLADLAPDARAALLLSSEGFSGAEIAAAIGRSEAATRTLLCRTRMKIRQTLDASEATR